MIDEPQDSAPHEPPPAETAQLVLPGLEPPPEAVAPEPAPAEPEPEPAPELTLSLFEPETAEPEAEPPTPSAARRLLPRLPQVVSRAMLGEVAILLLALLIGITTSLHLSTGTQRRRQTTVVIAVPTPTATASPSDAPSPTPSPTATVSAPPAGPGGPGAPGPAPVALGPPPAGDPAPTESTVVYTNGPATIQVYSTPDPTTPVQTLKGHNSIDQPAVFLVLDQQPGWYHVLLPVRPNGASGWLKASDVQVTTNRDYLRVTISQFRIDHYVGGVWQQGYRVAVGKPSTPTPTGRFYIIASQAVNQAPYTPGIFALSGFAAEALPGFLGATLGIHGWTDASVIGTRVSNGCVRLATRDMNPILHSLLLGTPVDIIG